MPETYRVELYLTKSYLTKWEGLTGGAAGDSAIDNILSLIQNVAGGTVHSQISGSATAIGAARKQSH